MGIWYGVASEFTWRPCGIMHVESTQQQQHDRERTRARAFSKLFRSSVSYKVLSLFLFSKLSHAKSHATHSAFITMPDMVIWAVYACMLGRTEGSARLRGALFTPTEQATPAVS